MKKYIFVLILVVILFNGFSNLREITELAIVTVMGLDIDDSGKYVATIEIIDADKEDSKKTITEFATGDSIQEAIRNIIDKTQKRLYLAHLETLIVSEDIAKNGLDNIVDFFIRDNDGSNNFYLFISKNVKASDIIQKASEEKISMLELLKSSEKYRGNGNTKTLSEIIQEELKYGKDVCVNSCGIKDDRIYIADMAYFKDWKMQDYIDEKDSILYNILNNNVGSPIIKRGEDEDLIIVEIVTSNTSIKLKKEKVVVDLDMKVNISEAGKNIELNTNEEVNNIEAILSNDIKDRINTFIQKYQIDKEAQILGFENLYYRKKKEYNKNVSFETNVDIKIANQGGVINIW